MRFSPVLRFAPALLLFVCIQAASAVSAQTAAAYIDDYDLMRADFTECAAVYAVLETQARAINDRQSEQLAVEMKAEAMGIAYFSAIMKDLPGEGELNRYSADRWYNDLDEAAEQVNDEFLLKWRIFESEYPERNAFDPEVERRCLQDLGAHQELVEVLVYSGFAEILIK